VGEAKVVATDYRHYHEYTKKLEFKIYGEGEVDQNTALLCKEGREGDQRPGYERRKKNMRSTTEKKIGKKTAGGGN